MLIRDRSAPLVTLLLAAFLALGSSQALSQASIDAGMPPERLAVLDRAIQAEVERGRVAGMVVAVARHDRIVHRNAYGYADRESGEAMTTEHLFRLLHGVGHRLSAAENRSLSWTHPSPADGRCSRS